jgi:hypothetical protein
VCSLLAYDALGEELAVMQEDDKSMMEKVFLESPLVYYSMVGAG